MILSQRLLLYGQRPVEERLGLVEMILFTRITGQIVQAGSYGRAVVPVGAFKYTQSLARGLLGFGEFALGRVDQGEVIPGRRDIRMVRPQGAFVDGQRLTE